MSLKQPKLVRRGLFKCILVEKSLWHQPAHRYALGFSLLIILVVIDCPFYHQCSLLWIVHDQRAREEP